MSACQLCARDTSKPWNVRLLESPNFVVLPSLGALVEGWLLIVPKQHFVSFGELPDSLIAEFVDLKAATSEIIRQVYGTVCAFEHGPSKAGCSVGCGVDHAHAHLVPVKFDLAAAVVPHLPKNSRWSDANFADCRSAFLEGANYLYLEQPIGKGRIIRNNRLGSQVFRRAIADSLGIPEQYNWRAHSQISNIQQTIQTLRTEARNYPSASVPSEYAA
jgi:diadenosine tetraphosphate (Ap4A) HIT family hydrolase